MRNRIIQYGGAAFFLTVPFHIQLNNVLLIGLSAASIILIQPKPLLHAIRQSTSSILLLAYFVLITISALWGGDEGGGRYIEKYLIVVALVVSFPLLQKHGLLKNALKYLNIGFAIACIACYFLSFWRYTDSGNYNEFLYLKLIDPIGFHALEFSFYLFFLGVYNLTRVKESKWNITFFMLFSVTILLLSVRTTILCYSLFLPVVLIYVFGVKKALLQIAAYFLIGFIVIQNTPSLKSRFQRVLNSKNELKNHNRLNGFSGRLVIWDHAMELIPEYIAIGLSPQGVQKKLNEKYKTDDLATLALNANYNCHNQYLQTQLGLGILGLALLLSIYARNILTSIKIRDMVMFSAALMLLLGSITESLLEIHRGLLFMILVTLLIDYRLKSSPK